MADNHDVPLKRDSLEPCPPDAERYETYCPDCDAQFYEGEEGYGQEECFECGESNCFEISA